MKTILYIIIMSFLSLSATADIPIDAEKAKSIVKELYASDIDEADSMPSPIKTEIEVTLIDLNNDKKPEILARIMHSTRCGSQGCTTVILEQQDKSWRAILDNLITHGDIDVSKEIFNGYKIINFGGGPNLKYLNGNYQFQKP